MFRFTFVLLAASLAWGLVGWEAGIITLVLVTLSTGYRSEPRIEVTVGERR